MNRITDEKQSLFPIVVMVIFTLILISALVLRVYQADRDLGILRISERQARLASESGVNYALEKMRKMILNSDTAGNLTNLDNTFFSKLENEKWISFGERNKTYFKIVSIRRMHHKNKVETRLQNEALRYQIMTEGRCDSFRFSTVAVIQLHDLVKDFCVTSSLNEYYYGNPIRSWINASGGLESFIKANEAEFISGALTRRGVCFSPSLLYELFRLNGKDPFIPTTKGSNFASNFGSIYRQDGKSPCIGPLYCDTPIVIDTHTFFAPVQTALYFYQRSQSQPQISYGNSAIAVNSSLRIQQAMDKLQGKNSSDLLVDIDSQESCPYISPWRPDFDYLKNLAKEKGIYIDHDGNGFLEGSKLNIDYHPGEASMYSDTYYSPNSIEPEQDSFKSNFIVLSSENNYAGFNNINRKNLHGAKIIFSERSIFFRGEIGSDLAIVTPGHIFLTGPSNTDSTFSLFLIAESGTAISTVDLEDSIEKQEQHAKEDFINAACQWFIRAVIYKPGAGIFTSKSRPTHGENLNFRGIFSGRNSLSLELHGACVGGNLQRWIDNSKLNGVRIVHKPDCADRLPVRPFSMSIFKQRTRPIE